MREYLQIRCDTEGVSWITRTDSMRSQKIIRLAVPDRHLLTCEQSAGILQTCRHLSRFPQLLSTERLCLYVVQRPTARQSVLSI